MILVLVLTVFVGLIEAVLVGLILSCVLFMKHIADVVEHRTRSTPLREFSREMPWLDEGDIIERFGHKVYVKHLDGPLFFGFALAVSGHYCQFARNGGLYHSHGPRPVYGPIGSPIRSKTQFAACTTETYMSYSPTCTANRSICWNV